MSFNHRSKEKELLDNINIPFADIKRNMEELDFINRHLGGHNITLRGISSFKNTTELDIAEIGCGGGDNLRAIEEWSIKRGVTVKLTGIDINEECIRFAKGRVANKNMHFVCGDYKLAKFEKKPDVIFSSLFCHHFSDNELVTMIQWMYENSRLGFFINDLHRHALAYYSIKVLSWLFSRSYMVKHDAPLSVKRGLLKNEWDSIFSSAGIKTYSIEWMWAFRWLITCCKDEERSRHI